MSFVVVCGGRPSRRARRDTGQHLQLKPQTQLCFYLAIIIIFGASVWRRHEANIAERASDCLDILRLVRRSRTLQRFLRFRCFRL